MEATRIGKRMPRPPESLGGAVDAPKTALLSTQTIWFVRSPVDVIKSKKLSYHRVLLLRNLHEIL